MPEDRRDKGPQHFVVGFVGGLVIGVLIGWLYLSDDKAKASEHPPVGCHTIACEKRVRAKQHHVRYHCRNHPKCAHRVRRHRRYLRAKVIARMPVTTASWYYDDGATASGRHYLYGFASLMYGSEWGKRVRFCYRMRCVDGKLQDHGPYVGGRGFDLNPALKGA